MKITESQLRSIIKQELNRALSEVMYSTSANTKKNQLDIREFTELIGTTVEYELGNPGEFARGRVASVNSDEYKFTLDPESVEFNFRGVYKKQKNLRPDELTHSIDRIIRKIG